MNKQTEGLVNIGLGFIPIMIGIIFCITFAPIVIPILVIGGIIKIIIDYNAKKTSEALSKINKKEEN